MPRCAFKPFVGRNSMASNKKFTFGFLLLISFSFALIISSDELQSKAQTNLQSLEENTSGYHAENKICFHR